jgi:hypothetical protein
MVNEGIGIQHSFIEISEPTLPSKAPNLTVSLDFYCMSFKLKNDSKNE